MKRSLFLFLGILLVFSFPKPSALEPIYALEGISESNHKTGYFPQIPVTRLPPKKCSLDLDLSFLEITAQQQFLAAFQKMPCTLLSSLRRIELVADPEMPRALAGRSLLKLRSDVFEKREIEALLIHEFAHVIDLGGLQGSSPEESEFSDGSEMIPEDDPSLEFYRISWESSVQRKKNAEAENFVSGYAMTDPFEDFAESLLFYRRHGRVFRKIARENDVLSEKYEFFRSRVFAGVEFETGEEMSMLPRPWDVTKI